MHIAVKMVGPQPPGESLNAEQRCECHRAGGNVGGIDVGLTEGSEFVFLA